MKHVLSISPPLHTLSRKWLMGHPAYTLSKYSMSALTLGMADVCKSQHSLAQEVDCDFCNKKCWRIPVYLHFARAVSTVPFSNVVVRILKSDESGLSLLDDDVVAVDRQGVDDIFI